MAHRTGLIGRRVGVGSDVGLPFAVVGVGSNVGLPFAVVGIGSAVGLPFAVDVSGVGDDGMAGGCWVARGC